MVARGGAAADDLSGRIRLGDPPHGDPGRAGCDPVPVPRRAARRPDGLAPARALRQRPRGDRMTGKPVLELREVTKSFGGLTVIDVLDLVVNEREIVSVIGPNGAGKTTVFNLVTGVYEPDTGDILLDGASIVGLEPNVICRRGVARTFQSLRLFLNMTVKENVMAAAYGHTKATIFESILRTPRARREEREINRLAEERLAFF